MVRGRPRVFRHCLSFALSFILLLCALPGGTGASPLADTPPPYVSCEAAILMEWQSGAILAQHNAFRRMYPASITKMMTALLALENGRLEAEVMVSPEAANQPGSSMYLSAGDVFSLEDLLYGLMLNSGNDAAWAIAEHIGGDAETFFDMMNKRAKEIGAINTRYRNPHGLTDPNHYTTAFDLALIARTCLRHPYFRKLVATKEKDVLDASEEVKLQLANTNRLLWVYLGADGVKTGTTESAGQCLVASATRDGMRLLAVVLNSADRWTDAARLLDYGFSNYRVEKAISAGEIITTVPALGAVSGQVALRCAADLLGCVPKDALALSIELEVPRYVKAPCPAGATVGRAVLKLGDDPVGSTDLVAADWVNRRTPAGDLVRALGAAARRLIRLGVM